jgi:glycosyltransferase involved in cell wall biosynthesis
MNILELCLSPGLGGLELYMFRCADALAQNQHVVAAVGDVGRLREYFREHADSAVHTLAKSSKHLPLINARRLARIIDSEHIDVVHMHWGNDLALAALAKKLSVSKPALVYTRQMTITRYKNDWYHRFMYAEMDLMLTITRQLEREAKRFVPVDDAQVTTLYYGVTPPSTWLTADAIRHQRDQLGFDADDFVIGLFGRLEHGKGQHLLIEALAMASDDAPQLKALIVGHEMKPGYRDELQRLAKNLGVSANMAFMDFVAEPQMLMQVCDCVTLASEEETFGLVLPEAMRCGIAVIGSNRGGVPEIITHEKTGLLFESGEASSLHQQICRLYTDPDFKEQLAETGKLEADERFDADDHFKALEKHILQTTRGQATTEVKT